MQKFKSALFFFLLILSGLNLKVSAEGVTGHDFHVSITEMRYNAQNQSLEVAVKIFTDDLEAALEGLGAPKLRLNSPREHTKTDTLIGRYLANRLKVRVNGAEVRGTFLGKEYESDATWCYIEFTSVPEPVKIKVSNRLLFERFDDQSNLVHIQVDGKKQSLLLHVGLDADTAEF